MDKIIWKLKEIKGYLVALHTAEFDIYIECVA